MAKETGLRKRSQIKKANRTMFIWVASMSAIAMVCLVVSYHLVLSTFFKGRVIAAQMQTIGNLDTSIKNTDSNNEESLGAQILALDTNENLAMVKANPEDLPGPLQRHDFHRQSENWHEVADKGKSRPQRQQQPAAVLGAAFEDFL